MAFFKLPVASLAAAALFASRLALAHETHNNNDRPVTTGEPWSEGCLPGPVLDRRHTSCVASPPASASSVPSYDEAAHPYNPKKYAPWTHQPYCPPETKYCVHTNADFGQVGVSLITVSSTKGENSKDAALAGSPLQHLESIFDPTFQPKRAMKKEMPIPPFVVRDLPGKGKGVVATSPIPRGTVLIVEQAAIVADSAFPMKVKREVGRRMLQAAILRVTKNGGERAIAELSRSNPDAEGVLAAEDVMKTNSFTVEIGGRSIMALFPRIAASRINHACKPSAIIKFDQETLSMTVRPLRDILPGEEITISYTTFGDTYASRQRTLSQKWGFKCTCSLCSASPEERAASDTRRNSITELGQKVIGRLHDADYPGAIKKHRVMMAAIEDEGLAPHMGDYYEVMTRLYAATGDMKNAKKYARLAIKEFEDIGEEKVEELEAFVRVV